MNLITGGGGFIGSHLVHQLLASGEPVRVLEHPEAVVNHLPLERIELVRADIRDFGAMRNMMHGCDRVYHLAADPNLWRRNRCEFDEINHKGTLNVMRAALDSGVSRVLYVSTESILTSDEFSGGAAESVRLGEEDMIGPYCLSKFQAEQAAFQLAEAGAPVIVCSPTLPMGPGDRNQTPPTRLSVAFCQGKIPVYLDCKLNLIDVRDVAVGLVRAMQRGRPGVRYLLAGHNCRLIEWLQILGDIVNRPAPRWTIPYPVALAIGWFSELWADHISHRMPSATVTGVRLTKRTMHFDPSATYDELGLEAPRPIEESARDAVSWYRKQHWI
ncbi:dihydroflavonol-4-reductase [Nitrosospira sp. Nsp2]|uniref:NAD-dependent epimerase/dehydratase family protein n=1 Tax=Nitrosospira sp. Nsp2 TaxID=136548 RepID=UPI000D313AEF|nr:NAD-dependent epimerase/dehydratase family protein [Nitrosospira sp. Nsp2]PTR16018.1 dihydroflavonol-4-reductase [Nitrosospira sp. Nsp2]